MAFHSGVPARTKWNSNKKHFALRKTSKTAGVLKNTLSIQRLLMLPNVLYLIAG